MLLFQGFIHQYGLVGIWILTAGDSFILPIPVEFLVALGIAGGLSFPSVLITVLSAAFAGAIFGYFLGRWAGHPVALWLFGRKRIDKAEAAIRKWGFWGVIIGGLLPGSFKIFVLAAGVFEMQLWKFSLAVLLGLIPRYTLTAYASVLFVKTKFYATTDMSAVILGALQGLTQYLPISSSGHLVVLEHFLKLPLSANDLAFFDIILHGGSLLAIVIFFRKDWATVFREIGRFIKTRKVDEDSLVLKLLLGSLPVILGALMFANLTHGKLRGLPSVGLFFILSACFYIYVEMRKPSVAAPLTAQSSVLIGLAQATAIIPGISRAGATIGTGMLLGLKREAAARFSFMLGAISILAANVFALFSASREHMVIPGPRFLLIGFFTAFVCSLASISFLMKYLQKNSLRPFAFYLLLVGALLISFF